MIIKETWSSQNIAKIETLYHTANGYIGVRNSPEEGEVPGSIRGSYINGIHEVMDIQYGEKLYGFPDTKQTLANVPDAQTIRIYAGDEPFSMFSDSVTEKEQTLDLAGGIATRSMNWQTADGRLAIAFERMASFELPNLFLIRCRITSETYTGSIRLESTLSTQVRNHADSNDPRVAAEPLQCFDEIASGIEEDAAFTHQGTRHSGQQICVCMSHETVLPGSWVRTENSLCRMMTAELQPGRTVVLYKYVIFTDTTHCTDVRESARQLLAGAMDKGGEYWFEHQKAFVHDLAEKSFVTLDGDADLQTSLDFDLFELIQSTGRDGLTNVAAKGLSGEGYEGHTFWDSEIYVLPFFLWTQPEVAKNMLTWRYHLLPKARENARVLGMATGALYPWRTISGGECSAFFPAGTAQYHIDGDIAYAFLQYWLVTGDLDFMADMGAEVLIETARMWMELGHMQNGQFRIDCVTGPDEYTCCVNNNFYTNAVAQYNLAGACAVMEALGAAGMEEDTIARTGITAEELRSFKAAADAMLLPHDAALGISMQDDSFLQKKKFDFKSLPKSDFPLLLHYHPLFLYRHQVCKQADTVLAHLLFPSTADPETVLASYHYYDAVTTHDSSLSVCVFATMAARLGLMDRAVEGFRDTATLDLFDTHGNTKDGLHTASLGGAYLAMLMGFGGIRVTAEGLQIEPVIPQEWKSYEIPLIYHGSRLKVSVTHEGCTVKRLSGESVQVRLNGEMLKV